jgi:hypothetical protein
MQKVVGSSPIIRFEARWKRRVLSCYESVSLAGCGREAPLTRVRLPSMRRTTVLLGLLCCAAFAAGAAARPAAAPATCVAAEVRAHNEAVFGHFATLAAAKALKARAAAIGFKGIKIENEGCGDFEVEIDGADRQADRTSFAQEAARSGYYVTFEQTAPPMQYQAGEVVGVFARKRTVGEANALMTKLSHIGFPFIDLVPEGKIWLVVMPQVPVKHALSIAHEVATAGYHIQFRTGTK